MSKISKEETALRDEYRTVLSEEYPEYPEMVDYCVKKCAEVVHLFNGIILPVNRARTETRFCFGYSDFWGPTYEEACASARDARESGEYFMRENMRLFTRTLEDLNRHGRDCFIVLTGDHRTRDLHVMRVAEVLEAVGGSAFLEDLKGREINVGWTKGYICRDEDVALIRAAYEKVAAAHEKKLRAYLKRYGTSKLHIWTYWRDE